MNPNTWAMLCHLSGLVGYLGNGLGSVVDPLVIWIVKKDALPEVDEHGKEALNFNISVAIYSMALIAFAFLTVGIGLIIVAPLAFVLFLFHLICTIQAAIKANSGEFYQYPLSIRLVK